MEGLLWQFSMTSPEGGASHLIEEVRLAPAHCPGGHATGPQHLGHCHPPVPQSHSQVLRLRDLGQMSLLSLSLTDVTTPADRK